MTTMKGAAASTIKPGEMESMHITHLDNGFMLETRRRQKPRKGNEPYDWDAGTTRMAFKDGDELAEHVRAMCGGKGKEKPKE
jgi:hypothetical protein